MTDDRKTHPVIQDDAADENDSRVIKDHNALENQSSVDAEDYPAEKRHDGSLVDKSKSARGSVVNPAPKDDSSAKD
ncbi:hypothetical protein ACXYL9_07670 [Qipengyuania sp. CAU 1752]